VKRKTVAFDITPVTWRALRALARERGAAPPDGD